MSLLLLLRSLSSLLHPLLSSVSHTHYWNNTRTHTHRVVACTPVKNIPEGYWPAGDTSAPGDSGTTGAPGDSSTSGASGAPGDSGATGAPGDSGTTGAPGDSGTTGAPGDNNGASGAPGDSGTSGATGAPGDSVSVGEGGEGEKEEGQISETIEQEKTREKNYFVVCQIIFSIGPLAAVPAVDTVQAEEPMEQEVLPGNDNSEDEATPPPVPPEVLTGIACCLEEVKKCIEDAPHNTVSVLCDV